MKETNTSQSGAATIVVEFLNC